MFPDGSEFRDAPVFNWDLMGDLAVIGPLDTSIFPVPLTSGEGLAIGSDVYLIGYPGEAQKFPQPTITKGLLSRMREWEAIEMTYFQTDAPIAGGQSGGLLVSEDGEVIGISGFNFAETGFGLVGSAADILPRVEKLIAGEDVAGLGDRRIRLEGGRLEHNLVLANRWDQRAYIVSVPAGTTVEISVQGENDAAIGLIDVVGGVLIESDDGVTGVEAGSAMTELAAPYFFVVGQFPEGPGEFHLTSNRTLIPYHDPDDGIELAVGQSVVASMDYPTDVDYFVIDLAEGDTVVITVDSANFDPIVVVAFPGATAEQPVFDDDSGGGLFGGNAKITYRAPHAGSYFISLGDALDTDVGGYILSVTQAAPGAVAVSPPPTVAVPTLTTTTSPFGVMAVYESVQYGFSIKYPAEWQDQRIRRPTTDRRVLSRSG